MDGLTRQMIDIAKKNKDLKSMKRIYEDNFFHPIIKFEYAKMLLNENYIEEAKEIFESLLDSNNNEYALFELGKLEYLLGNVDIARKYLEKLIKSKKSSNFKYAMLELGKLEASEGNLELAEYYFEKLYNSYKDEYALLELGKVKKQLGKIEEARTCLKTISNSKTKEYAIMELGFLEYAESNIELAEQYFKSLLETHNRPSVLRRLIILNIKIGNLQEAYKCLLMLKEERVTIDNKVELYLMKELNFFFNMMPKIYYNYNNVQLIDYDEYVAVEHIVAKHSTSFGKNIDIYRLFKEIDKELKDEYKSKKLVFNDMYDVLITNELNNEIVVRVVTIPNTKQILTMYPLGKDDEEEQEFDETLVKKLEKKNYRNI